MSPPKGGPHGFLTVRSRPFDTTVAGCDLHHLLDSPHLEKSSRILDAPKRANTGGIWITCGDGKHPARNAADQNATAVTAGEAARRCQHRHSVTSSAHDDEHDRFPPTSAVPTMPRRHWLAWSEHRCVSRNQTSAPPDTPPAPHAAPCISVHAATTTRDETDETPRSDGKEGVPGRND